RSSSKHNHGSPGHHVDGGSFAAIFVARSATKWLRLYGSITSFRRISDQSRPPGNTLPLSFGPSKPAAIQMKHAAAPRRGIAETGYLNFESERNRNLLISAMCHEMYCKPFG